MDVVPSLVKRILDLKATDKDGDTVLHRAVVSYPIDVVKCLVEEGANINAKGQNGATPLLYAAMQSRKDVFNLLLCAEANVNICDDDGLSVLHRASGNGSEWMEIVQSLVKRVPDLNATNKNGETALHDAAIGGSVEVTKHLVEEGANIDAKSHTGSTPLLYSAKNSCKDVFHLLLCAGANVDICDNEECSVLHHASGNGNGWVEIVQSLVKRVANLDATDEEGKTALHFAAFYGCLEIVKCLVEEGADINARSEDGATPLLYASAMGHRDVSDLLLYAGTNVDFWDSDNCTVLHYALKFSWIEEVQYLVKRVHDLEIRDLNGETALHKASHFGLLEAVRCLVEEGADINAKNSTGYTPLLYAGMTGSRDVFGLLLDAGANVDGREDRLTVLHYAVQMGWSDIVPSLVKRIPDINKSDKFINARDMYGKTALHLACVNQNLDIVYCLLQANARCDIRDVYGNSPLFYLVNMERPSVKLVKLLIENGGLLLPDDYDAILKSSFLKVEILQDIKFCCQAIVNKFNNRDLIELYNLPVAWGLPDIEKMKVQSRSEVFQAIQRRVRFEIETEGHCIQLKEHPMALNVLCVKSVLEYYDDKKLNCNID